MRRGLSFLSSVKVVAPAPCVRSSLSRTSCASPLSVSHQPSLSMTQRRAHSTALFSSTPVCLFDLRKHEMEKRRQRELEKAGIDPHDDDDGPWIAPEEQQRLDEEEEQRRAELEEQRKAFLAKRAEEDAAKRQKFKEFRAKQISMSRHRKEELAEKKEEARQHRREQQQQRVVGEGGDEVSSDSGEGTQQAQNVSTESAAGGSAMK